LPTSASLEVAGVRPARGGRQHSRIGLSCSDGELAHPAPRARPRDIIDTAWAEAQCDRGRAPSSRPQPGPQHVSRYSEELRAEAAEGYRMDRPAARRARAAAPAAPLPAPQATLSLTAREARECSNPPGSQREVAA
jgi:hypothetical protein